MDNSSEREPDSTLSIGKGAYCVLAGMILPVICFAIAFRELPEFNAKWQSGRLRDFAPLLISGPASRAFFPLLLYSITALGCLLANGPFTVRHFWMRWGVYAGLWLAMQFGILLNIVIAESSYGQFAALTGIGLVILVAPLAIAWVSALKIDWINQLGVVVFGILTIAGVIMFPVPLMLSLMFAPWLTAGAYLIGTIHLLRRTSGFRFSLASLLFLVTWISAYAATCRAAWTLAMARYAELPVNPPSNCFVATAAAKGHPWLVGSTAYSTGTGSFTNHQLWRLKGLELLLQAASPRAHRKLRSIYNIVGPIVAARLNSRWSADTAYLLLKPLEAVAWLCLKVLKYPTSAKQVRNS